MTNQERLSDFAQGEQESNGWEERTFSEVISINDYPSLEKGKEQTYVAMGDLDGFDRKIKETSKKEYKYSAPRFKNGDTLFAKMSRCLELGKTAYVDILDEGEIAFGSTEFMVMRPKSDEILPKFVYYTVRREDIRQHALSWATGSTARRQRISTDLFDNLTIKIPPTEKQKEIVGFLDSIDTKIETNNRINALLEELARTIYRSCFVNFDPYDEFKNSELGEVPVDFQVEKLPEICEIVLGGTPDTNTDRYWDGDIEWAKAKDVSHENDPILAGVENTITKAGLNESSAEMVPEFTTVIVARGATLGEMAMTPDDIAINQTCYGLVPKKSRDAFYLYFLMDALLQDLKSRSHGTVFDTVTKRTLNEQNIPLAPVEDRNRFNQKVSPLMKKIKQNHKENKHLAELRDTLLPKLMSGKTCFDAERNNQSADYD